MRLEKLPFAVVLVLLVGRVAFQKVVCDWSN